MPAIKFANISQLQSPLTSHYVNPALADMLRDYADLSQPGYYSGNSSAEDIMWNHNPDFNFRDVVYGGGGYDYISTGGGDDKIVLGSNAGGTWNGWKGSGNEIGRAAIADGSNGNDDIQVRGVHGAFEIYTGEGRDSVTVTGATGVNDYVKIFAYDGDTAQDTFTFGASFNGRAEIAGVDSFDQLVLKGGDWHLNATGGNVVWENSTGGSVFLSGVTHNYNDPSVILV